MELIFIGGETMKKRLILILLTASLALALLSGCGQQDMNMDTGAFAQYATTVDSMVLPENARMIALGEATHGNAEFQELKLDMLKVLVEKHGVRSLALEGDFGGCAVVNDYIHGGAGTAQDAVNEIGFQLYRTKEMAQLADWMRAYNETAPAGDELNFYGFDMQRVDNNVAGLTARYLATGSAQAGALCDQLTALYAEGMSEKDGVKEERRAVLNAIGEDLAGNETIDAVYARHYAEILLQNIELSETDGADYGTVRDAFMAENIEWVQAVEEALGRNRIFISGHNGHISKVGAQTAGSILYNTYGGEYFAIGTDFYNTRCNLPSGDGRAVHRFCSKDPLAKMARDAKLPKAYLDLNAAKADPALNKCITEAINMGSLGETYSLLMLVLPQTYRIYAAPEYLYDAMIFVPDATPTQILP